MRTDGVSISPDVITSVRDYVRGSYGAEYLPDSPRSYKSKAKNAQEAHEAIRPTQPQRQPAGLPVSNARLRRLYDLIWRRTLASQMASARIRRVGVDAQSAAGDITLRATGSATEFPGFLAVYGEVAEPDAGLDGQAADDSDSSGGGSETGPGSGSHSSTAAAAAAIRQLKEGEALTASAVDAQQHFTAPQPRFTEGSLVKTLEELGIGRPSTYAPILQLLQTRGYVSKNGKALKAEPLGWLLTAFLATYFPRYVDYGFTAGMEDLLDEVSGGRAQWKDVVGDFWSPLEVNVQQALGVSVTEVIDQLDELLAPMLFPHQAVDEVDTSSDHSSSSSSGSSRTSSGSGEHGGSDGSKSTSSGSNASEYGGRRCPACGGRLGLKLSRQGGFVGCSGYPDCGYSRPLNIDLSNKDAISAAAAPLFLAGGDQLLGQDPETGRALRLRNGPYGPYLHLEAGGGDGEKAVNVSLPPSAATADMSLQEALELLRGVRIGMHPDDGQPISLETGKYGPYLKWGAVNAALPKAVSPESLTMQQAVELLAKKAARNAAKALTVAESSALDSQNGAADAAATEKPKRGRAKSSAATAKRKPASSKAAAPTKSAAKPAGGSKAKGANSKTVAAAKATTASNKAAKGSAGKAAANASASSRAKASRAKTSAKAESADSKPPSAYQTYCSANWNAVKGRHPQLTGRELFAAVSKELGAQWRAMSPAQQAEHTANGSSPQLAESDSRS